MNSYTDPRNPPTVHHGDTFGLRLYGAPYQTNEFDYDWSTSPVRNQNGAKELQQSNGTLAAPNGWSVTNVTPGPVTPDGTYQYIDVTIQVAPRCYSAAYQFLVNYPRAGSVRGNAFATYYSSYTNSIGDRGYGLNVYYDFAVACDTVASVVVTGASAGANVPYQGAAQVTASGGVSPYSYIWSVSSATGQATITSGQGTAGISFTDVTGTSDNPTTTTVTCVVSDDAGCGATARGRYVAYPGSGGGGGGGGGSASKAPGALTLDGARQWLHVAQGKAPAVSTYHAGDGSLAFASPAYAVDFWAAFRTDPRRSTLHLLGMSGGSALVFLSGDGGKTATKVLTVTTANALLEVLSEKGMVVLLSTDAATAASAGNVSCQQSVDGGQTYPAGQPSTLSGARLVAILADITYDPRRNALDMLCTVGGAVGVLESKDGGLSWTRKL